MFERLLTSFQNILKIPELRTHPVYAGDAGGVSGRRTHPAPGINGEALSEFLQKQGGALLGFLDIFPGGSLSRLTIFALGIMPYISASIILQLLTVVVPHLSKLARRENGVARRSFSTRVWHHRNRVGSGIRDRHRPRTDERRRVCLRQGLGVPADDRDYTDGRHRVLDVAGRADYGTRHRQRDLLIIFARHRGTSAFGRGADL